MKSIQIEFSKYDSVNFLWSELIEHYGFEKAKKIVSQAIDLQKMNGNKNVTMPIIFSGTGGLALIPIQSFKDNILSRGNTDHPMNLYVGFRGREPKVDALLKKTGLA